MQNSSIGVWGYKNGQNMGPFKKNNLRFMYTCTEEPARFVLWQLLQTYSTEGRRNHRFMGEGAKAQRRGAGALEGPR